MFPSNMLHGNVELKNQRKEISLKLQVLNVTIDYLVGNLEKESDELDNIELLFRMNSKGLTERKGNFKLIEFMEREESIW